MSLLSRDCVVILFFRGCVVVISIGELVVEFCLIFA